MREKLETLSLAALRDIAKNKQIKNISAMRKKELIDAILETVSDEENNKTAEQTPALQEHPDAGSGSDEADIRRN